MANQEPHSEDFEPEGEDVELTGDLADEEAFEHEAYDEFLVEAFSEYESEDPEAFDALEVDDTFFEKNGRNPRRPPRSALADQVARMALKWGDRATTTAIFDRNGHTSVARKPADNLAGELFEEEYLDELDPDLFSQPMVAHDAKDCSAALLEDYELMDSLAIAAAATEDAAEAVGLIAAIIPLAIRQVPTAYRALWPAIPVLIRGAVGVTRLLRGRPATRPLIKMMPLILCRTTTQLARQIANGQPPTRRLAAKTLARSTMAVLSNFSKRDRVRPPSRRSRRRRRKSLRPRSDAYNSEWGDNGFGP